MEKEIKIILGFAVAIILVVVFIVGLQMTGLHIQTGTGKHVGYITSTETIGLFFKTERAYLKTDTQSSQEESYCVIDSKVFNELQSLSEKHAHVEVSYFDWFAKGIAYCDGENGGVISSVIEIK